MTKDTARPALRRLLANSIPNRPLMARLGKALERFLRQHFKVKDQTPNRRNWAPRSHFWARRVMTSTVLSQVSPINASVKIGEPGFRLHYYGGTVRPKEKKFLAIPLQEMAYGKRPSSGLIPGLFVLRTAKGAYLAAKGDASGRHRIGTTSKGRARFARNAPAGLHLYWKLVKRAKIRKDPAALPKQSAVDRELLNHAEQHYKRLLRGYAK